MVGQKESSRTPMEGRKREQKRRVLLNWGERSGTVIFLAGE